MKEKQKREEKEWIFIRNSLHSLTTKVIKHSCISFLFVSNNLLISPSHADFSFKKFQNVFERNCKKRLRKKERSEKEKEGENRNRIHLFNATPIYDPHFTKNEPLRNEWLENESFFLLSNSISSFSPSLPLSLFSLFLSLFFYLSQ